MTKSENATQDALRRLQDEGDDLTRPRDVDFTTVFQTEDSAKEFAHQLHALGYEASVEATNTSEGFPWDVVVTKKLTPSYGEIGTFERLLQEIADKFDGHNDGWGCFSEAEHRLPE